MHAERQRAATEQLVETHRQLLAVEDELIKARQRNARHALTAPVDGVVQQLALHTVGGVVTPAQALMVIVPNDETLEIEARIANQDIGFVYADQAAEVKVETFQFTK